jgi:hypothetical protein
MKIVQQGLLFIFTLYLSVIYIMTVENFHRLKFITDIRIVPLKHYSYKTCTGIMLTVDKVPLFQKQYGSNGECEWMP